MAMKFKSTSPNRICELTVLIQAPQVPCQEDSDGNENVRKQRPHWVNEEKSRAARAARTLVQSFDVVCQMTT